MNDSDTATDFRHQMIADGHEDIACQRQESIDEMTSHLEVHDNETGPGFYIGDKDDPENMEHSFNEVNAYEILEAMKEEFVNDM